MDGELMPKFEPGVEALRGEFTVKHLWCRVSCEGVPEDAGMIVAACRGTFRHGRRPCDVRKTADAVRGTVSISEGRSQL